MARREWADNKVSSAQRRWSGLNMIEIAEEVLLAEHARAVRIVKAEIKRVRLDQHNYSSEGRMGRLFVLEKVLAALQKGRA